MQNNRRILFFKLKGLSLVIVRDILTAGEGIKVWGGNT
jgi:hypothetical protein